MLTLDVEKQVRKRVLHDGEVLEHRCGGRVDVAAGLLDRLGHVTLEKGCRGGCERSPFDESGGDRRQGLSTGEACLQDAVEAVILRVKEEALEEGEVAGILVPPGP